MNYMVHVSNTIWRTTNQPPTFTSRSDYYPMLSHFCMNSAWHAYHFKWRLHFQFGVAFRRVIILWEVHFEGLNRVWRALKTSILNTGRCLRLKTSTFEPCHIICQLVSASCNVDGVKAVVLETKLLGFAKVNWEGGIGNLITSKQIFFGHRPCGPSPSSIILTIIIKNNSSLFISSNSGSVGSPSPQHTYTSSHSKILKEFL